MVTNAAILCNFNMGCLDIGDLVDVMVATTGFDYDLEELMECGERIWVLKRGLNNLMGITAADDRLPKRIMTPTQEGPAAGSVPNMDLMLKEYYRLRGLDVNGHPIKEKLHSLGLSNLAAKLSALPRES
jgi:aldehyde:ferredoxin oxidoreductase